MKIKVHSIIDELSKIYGKALQAFYLHKNLTQNYQERQKNFKKYKIIKDADFFWGGIQYSLQVDYIIEIAKFFEVDDKTANVRQLKDFHEKWEKKINLLLTKNFKNTIAKIRKIRNNYIAHSNWSPEKIETPNFNKEIEELFPIMRKIIDIASKDIKNSSLYWDSESHVEEYCKEDIDYIFELLDR